MPDNQETMIFEASTKINDPDPVIAIRSALICTTTKGVYFSGLRNGLRYAISILTGEEPKFEDASGN